MIRHGCECWGEGHRSAMLTLPKGACYQAGEVPVWSLHCEAVLPSPFHTGFFARPLSTTDTEGIESYAHRKSFIASY